MHYTLYITETGGKICSMISRTTETQFFSCGTIQKRMAGYALFTVIETTDIQSSDMEV
jgi:hypothetical protein